MSSGPDRQVGSGQRREEAAATIVESQEDQIKRHLLATPGPTN
jgi:hypothetical protein